MEVLHALQFHLDRIRPICLPVNGMIQFKDFVGTNPFVAGWGTTKEVRKI